MPSILIDTDLPFSGSFESFTSISNWIFFDKILYGTCTYRVVGSVVNCNPQCQYKVATEYAASVFIYNSTCTRFYMMCTAAKSRIGWRTFYKSFRWIFFCRVPLFISISGAVSFTCIGYKGYVYCIGREWIWWGHRVQLFSVWFRQLNFFLPRFSVIQLIKTIVFRHFILS